MEMWPNDNRVICIHLIYPSGYTISMLQQCKKMIYLLSWLEIVHIFGNNLAFLGECPLMEVSWKKPR